MCVVVDREGTEGEMLYYTTPLQLEAVMDTLDAEYYEKDLFLTLDEFKAEIIRQMTLTEELTRKGQGTAKSVLDVLNGQWFSYIYYICINKYKIYLQFHMHRV